MSTPNPGDQALIRHVGRATSSTKYQEVKVTRVTKARVFVRADYEHASERQFRLDNLREYGEGNSWLSHELIVDPEAIAKVLAGLVVEKARRELEGQALSAMADLSALFDSVRVRNRSEAEIAALVALRDSFRKPAPESDGPG